MDGQLDYGFRMRYIGKIIEDYHKLKRKEKGIVLSYAVRILGYNRKYLIYLLNNPQKVKKETPKITGRGVKPKYKCIKHILKDIWEKFNYPWSKRLKVIITENLVWIKKNYNLVENEIELLKSISCATIDRLLKDSRIKIKKRIYGRTKPGSLLKREIPIIIERGENINEPGHLQIDIVAHCGNSASGEFNWTLNATDIYSQWSESVCIVNKSEHEVINAIEEIKRRLPFKIKTINSDNGSEFINWHLLRYCKRENIILTRTRPYKKDDNAYIEQKNWTNVRKLLGWERYEGKEVADLINDLYSNELRLYFNLFMPSVKLIEVKRIGSRIKKIYEEPKTPLQRLSEKYLKDEKIKKLMELKSQLNPFELAKKIEEKLEKIYQKKCKKIKSPKTQKREEMLNKIKEWLKKEKNYLWLDYF